MGLHKTVDTNLSKAFRSLKDLALVATFNKKTITSFDFSRSVVKSTASEEVTAKVVIIHSAKTAEDRNVKQMQIMFKMTDVGDLLLFETVTLLDEVWKIGRHVKSDRFINIIELFKEG